MTIPMLLRPFKTVLAQQLLLKDLVMMYVLLWKLTHTYAHHQYLEELLYNINRNKRVEISRNKRVEMTLLTWAGVELYLYEIIKKIDFITFFDLLTEQRFLELEKILPISDFAQDKLTLKVENVGDYEEINKNNLAAVYRSVLRELIKNKSNLHACFEAYFEAIDNFNIMFNVNSKESSATEGILLKPIEKLSLGQQVAAILTFIFKFGIHTNDNTPLLIDQPEDNLDSQYIYKNLVGSLRNIKNSRQVIVVTHNSTIVTNAAAEQVIVMGSDNNKGWIEQSGYQRNKNITKSILQYLEGGEESFLHKMKTYTTILGFK